MEFINPKTKNSNRPTNYSRLMKSIDNSMPSSKIEFENNKSIPYRLGELMQSGELIKEILVVVSLKLGSKFTFRGIYYAAQLLNKYID